MSPEKALIETPPTWRWLRIDEIGITQTGTTPPSGEPLYFGNFIPFVKPADLNGNSIDYAGAGISEAGIQYSRLISKRSILMVCIGATLGKANLTDRDVCCNQQINAVTPYVDELAEFTLLALKASYFQELAWAKAGTGTLPILSKGKWEQLPIPVPPIAEQHRIVAKVDELMALCDRLEATQHEQETRREQLTASVHHHLNNGGDAEELRTHAQFFIGHLPRLTTRPDQIKQLRQTILNLAVRGKLVPQSMQEGTACELLEQVQAEAIKLSDSQTLRLNSTLASISENEKPFALPENWAWTRFGRLIIGADAGWSPVTESFPRSGDAWGVLKVSAVSWNRFLPNENKQLLPGVKPPVSAQVRKGDFLISRANTSELVASSVIVEDEPVKLILSDKIVRLKITGGCNQQYLCMVNNHTEHARSYYAETASGTSLSMKNVSRSVIYSLLVPLPPLAEQHRIVAKADELMALCDKLEVNLTTAQTETSRLLESVLHAALNGDHRRIDQG
jgi:type I restriction enzyme S subunit